MRNDRWERDQSGIEVFDVDVPQRPARVRNAGRGGNRRRRGPNWRPISLLVVAALAAVAIVALADRPSVMPGPSAAAASVAPTASPAPPTPSAQPADVPATLGPYWPAQIGLPVITVPASAARVADRSPGPSASPTGSATGPFWWEVTGSSYEVPGQHPAEVTVIDVGRNTWSLFAVPIKKGETVRRVATDGAWLAAEVTDFGAVECPKPAHWRLLVTPLRPDGLPDVDAGGFAEVAHGTTAGQTMVEMGCIAPSLVFSLRAGRLAWVEDGSDSRRHVVEVRGLKGTRLDQTLSVKRHAFGLTVSRDAVAWVESSDPLAWLAQLGMEVNGTTNPDWQVMEARLGDAAPQPVDVGGGAAAQGQAPPEILLDGEAVVATISNLRSTPGVPMVVRSNPSGAPTAIEIGSQERWCKAWDAAGGTVLLACVWPYLAMSTPESGLTPVTLGAVWTPTTGLRAVTVGTDGPPELWIAAAQPGWAVFYGSGGYTAVPMSALTAR